MTLPSSKTTASSLATESLATEILIVGGGPAGLSTALLLARSGWQVTVLRPPPGDAPELARTTALLQGSMALMRFLGLWHELAPCAAALKKMRLIDGRTHLLRAPTLMFSADELGLSEFGFNIPNHALVAALETAAAAQAGLTLIAGTADSLSLKANCAEVRSSTNVLLSARLVIGADGRNSLVRRMSGIATTSWRYPQTALTLNLDHVAEHNGISSEFHTASGPFTLVPLPGRASSLVAVCTPQDAANLFEMPDDHLAKELEARAHHLLGPFKISSKRAAFPLGGHGVKEFAKGRTALIGEAAHALPPIGAQGLNLGLRDAIHLADALTTCRNKSGEIGGPDFVLLYNRARRADVWTRTAAVDLVNRSLLAGWLPIDAARGLTFFAAQEFTPLRRLLMRSGLGQNGLDQAMDRLGMGLSKEDA